LAGAFLAGADAAVFVGALVAADDFFAVVVFFAGEEELVDPAVDFFAGALLAVLLLAVDLLAVLLLAVLLLAVDFAALFVVVLLAVLLEAGDFRAADFVGDVLAVEAFAVVVFCAGVVLAAVFLAVVFWAVAFWAVVFWADDDFFAAVDVLAEGLTGDAFLAAAAADAAALPGTAAAAPAAASVSLGSFLAPETTFLRSAPGLNFGTAFFLALMRSPVCGLRTQRASRMRFSNEPKPVMATFSPFATSRVIVSSTASRAWAAALRLPS
jgi:hypothetical protein